MSSASWWKKFYKVWHQSAFQFYPLTSFYFFLALLPYEPPSQTTSVKFDFLREALLVLSPCTNDRFSLLSQHFVYTSLWHCIISWLLVDISICCTRTFADWLVRWMDGWMEDRWIPWHQRRLIVGKCWQLPHHS